VPMAWLVGFPRKAARAHCAIVLEHSRSLCTAGEHLPTKLGNQPCIFILKIEQSEAQRCDRKLGPVDVRELVRAFLARGEAGPSGSPPRARPHSLARSRRPSLASRESSRRLAGVKIRISVTGDARIYATCKPSAHCRVAYGSERSSAPGS
jgi:hypothetical protein